MKTISSALYAVLLKNRAPAFLAHLSWPKKKSVAWLLIFFISLQHLSAQDILIKNPSLEGVRGQVKAPPSWVIAFNTPDIQPGVLGIDLPASQGATYAGLHSGKGVLEGIAQEIFLKGQRSYTFSFDLAYAPLYIFKACYGDLSIYGSDSATQTTDLLWNSGKFYNTDWKRFTAEFKTTRSYRYIIFVADVSGECDKSKYSSALLIDNLSATMREMPQITFNVEHTCMGAANGRISANVSGVTPPYTYLWKPGGQTTSSIANLDRGTYEVTVTAANGTQATASTVIRNTDLKSEVSTITSDCNGENKNEILINTKGGIPPYQYYLNKNDHASYTPVFKDLRPGSYVVKVKDEHGCTERLENITLTEPTPLVMKDVNTTGTSCSSTIDGKIALNVTGGTAPYAYRLETKEWQSDNVLSNLEGGTYYYQVKDKNNCQVNGSAAVIKNIRECAVFVPTAFSPNGDGLNDLFRVKLHDEVHDFHLDVYSRWGQRVFSTTNPEGAWDGAQQPVGNYIWVLLYTDSKQQARKQTGSLMLVK
jgi:gliding motility-associated-like protein